MIILVSSCFWTVNSSSADIRIPNSQLKLSDAYVLQQISSSVGDLSRGECKTSELLTIAVSVFGEVAETDLFRFLLKPVMDMFL